MPGTATVYRWELFKLRYQKRTYLGLGAAAIVPILFVLAVHFRPDRRGGDFAFSGYLDRSGLAVPLVLLLFGAKRLPDLARGVGRSLRIFKAEMKAGRPQKQALAIAYSVQRKAKKQKK